MAAPLTRPPRPATRGRPPAIPDEELRERMFTAAQQMLDDAGGFTLSTENVQLEAVMRRADVSRSAVYRVWPTKEDFTFELIQAFASDGPGGIEPFGSEGEDTARKLVADNPDKLASPEGRRELMAEAIRVVTAHNFRTIIETRRWRRYAALTITADALDEERAEQVLATMRTTEDHVYAGYTDFYRGMFTLLQLRPKPPFTDDNAAHDLTRLTIALFQGLALQHTVNPAVGDTTYPDDTTDGHSEWTLPALGFFGLVDTVCEPAPAS